MKISINWLKEYINFSETPEEISNLLTKSGLEVTHIESFRPIKTDLSTMLIGQIVACTKHPNADKLHCTQIDIGTDKPLSIVCGAPNVEIGKKVAVAPVGTTLYTHTGECIKIKSAKIRGEISEGMLCAEDEIGLGPSHEKILWLDTHLLPGTPLSDYFNLSTDTILTIELTPNRIDACSYIGVARDLRALLNKPIQYPATLTIQSQDDRQLLPIKISVEDAIACPRYAGIVIKGVQVQESPQWVQAKLKSIGLPSINNIVDITNLVMYELGQPLHAFDYDKLKGKEIHVRLATKGERIVTLDNVDRELTGGEIVIADQQNNIALAGILGGISTSIQSETNNIFLESAYFFPATIRSAAKHHKIQTDAAFRYERGIDPNVAVTALRRAGLLIQEIASGKIASELIDIYPHPIKPSHIEVFYTNIQKLIGEALPKTTIHHILQNLDIEITNNNETSFIAIVPPYRVDVTREVDVIEEILRIYGYDNIQLPAQLSSTFLAPTKPPLPYQLERTLAPILTANGYQEICTNSLSFVHDVKIADNGTEKTKVKLLNPLSDKLNILRDNLVLSGLEVIAHNINRKLVDLKLFEFGKTYHQEDGKYIERNKLGIWLTGKIEALNWIRQPKDVTFQDLNTIIHLLLAKWGVNTFDQKPFSNTIYKAGVEFIYQGISFAIMGQVSKQYLQMADINQPVFFAEVDIDQLSLYPTQKLHYKPISKFPLVKRDLSLVIDEPILLEDIKNVLSEQAEPLIQDMYVFDIYQGTNLPKGKKAYALSFSLQDKDKTLDEKTIHQVMARLMNDFQQKLGAIVRE
ncbi:MAG: phenylalanine--tRNA ligase subunit beta [Candidatus Amoebophilus sp.]